MTSSECLNSTDAAAAPADYAGSGRSGLLAYLASALRYRFFIIAGVLPYALGWAAAYHYTGRMNWPVGALGLAGVILLGLGIEGMNEYFDARIGGDRVFASVRRTSLWWHLPLGLAGFGGAAAVAAALAAMQGWGVLLLALVGAAIALSYLIPPVRLSHRGLGEAVIAIGYGPGLVLGGFYLQTGRITPAAALASLTPRLLMFAMSLANEVPDYYGDRLVGKRNLIVRLGQRNGVILLAVVMALCGGAILAGVLTGALPITMALCLLLAPSVWMSLRHGLKHCSSPILYVRVVRTMIIVFVITNVVAIVGYVIGWNV